jgi:hypothetical protein
MEGSKSKVKEEGRRKKEEVKEKERWKKKRERRNYLIL